MAGHDEASTARHSGDDPRATSVLAPAAGPDPTHLDHPAPATEHPTPADAQEIASSQYEPGEPMSSAGVHSPEDAEGQHLLREDPEEAGPSAVPRAIAFRLYTSHFLSTWNSRVFEFGAALFLTDLFPGTLLPVSIYCLLRSAGCILFAQPLGRWMNRGNRLSIIRTSIVGQRVPVAVSCALLIVLEMRKDESGGRENNAIFAVIVLLAVVEKLCSILNTISVERDWVVVITEGNEIARRVMNARMRRIDLFCKLMGPLAISLVSTASTEIAIYFTLGMNVASVVTEYCFIEQVYRRVSGLEREDRGTTEDNAEVVDETQSSSLSIFSVIKSSINAILPVESLPFYFRHPVFLASFALSLLHLTVLSFSGQMITYLISVGYTSWHVGVARVGSSLFEISATWTAPFLMRKIGVVRAGIWSLTWQMACLGGALAWHYSYLDGAGKSSVLAATGLVVGVALSRIGLWGYDLSAQNIIQDEVEDDHRGTFSAVEASFQNLFEMLSYATTIIFSRPDQFQYPMVISVAAVYSAGGFYAYFVRKRRGHLFHAPPCVRPKA